MELYKRLNIIGEKMNKSNIKINEKLLKIARDSSKLAITIEDSLNAVKIFMNSPYDKSYRKCLRLSKKFKHGRRYKKQIKRMEKIRRKREVNLNGKIHKTYMGNIK